MADQSYYDDYDGSEEGDGRFARARTFISTLIGAVLAFALLLGLGIWFYRLGVRDAQNIPVIRAAVAPAKERPTDPGGTQTPHQSRVVYNAVDGSEEPSATAAMVIAEPPQPKPSDLPMQALAPVAPKVEPTPAPDAAPAATPPVTAPPATAPVRPTPSVAPAQAAAPAEEKPEQVAAVAPEPEPEASAPEFPSASRLAPAASPVVPPRPANLSARFAAAQSEPDRDASALAERAAASKYQIQLMADPDQAVVRSHWDKVYSDNRDILRDRALTTPSIQSGGNTFYRLRVGPFRDQTEAVTVCRALKARGQDCFVTDDN